MITYWKGLMLVAMLHLSSQIPAWGEVATAMNDGERIEHAEFYSQAFGERKKFCVVLPHGYSTNQIDWPVLYLLHGRGRNERSLIDDPTTCEVLLGAPFVTVLPNGEDGWYINSPVNSKQKYASLLEETIAAAEAKYWLSRDPKRRAIAGWSMGGFGCMNFAANHPNQFALAASIIGLLDFPRQGLPAGQSYDVPTKVFGKAEAEWRKLNPINAAERLRGMSILLIAADDAFDRTMNDNFRERLRELKIEHEWVMLKGTHHFDVVKQAVPMVVKQVQAKFDESKSAASK
jgi:S-formylglutathione hydrolase FrmB